MARTALTVYSWVANSHLTDPNPDTADAANGHTIAAAKTERLMLRFYNTAVAAKNAIVKAGANPPAVAASLGDLTVSVGASGIEWIGPLESGRFIQADGSLSVDLQAGFTGSITAFLLPKAT
jgi:hypothetical protein